MYPLHSLIRVREHRETVAQQNLQAKKIYLNQCKIDALQKEQQWKNYVLERPNMEKKAFARIQGSTLPQIELQKFFSYVADLRSHELYLQDEAIKAQKIREEAERETERLQKVYLICIKNVKKLQEHQALWNKNQAAMRILSEEKELEDVSFVNKRMQL
ncbi:MAG: YscO family type III secretion system apparatus protein [Pseudomonadota bacterium]